LERDSNLRPSASILHSHLDAAGLEFLLAMVVGGLYGQGRRDLLLATNTADSIEIGLDVLILFNDL